MNFVKFLRTAFLQSISGGCFWIKGNTGRKCVNNNWDALHDKLIISFHINLSIANGIKLQKHRSLIWVTFSVIFSFFHQKDLWLSNFILYKLIITLTCMSTTLQILFFWNEVICRSIVSLLVLTNFRRGGRPMVWCLCLL